MDRATVSSTALHAEVEEIWPRDGQILIHGTVVGADSGEGTRTLVVRARELERAELRLPATGSGSRFEARIPVDTLAAACAAPKQTWDLHLELPGHDEPLRLGSHLDDITGKKKIFTYPAQTAAGTWVEPFYTIKDNLSVSCRREAAA